MDTKWEYLVVSGKPGNWAAMPTFHDTTAAGQGTLGDVLNYCGERRWELVSVPGIPEDGAPLFFKRPAP